MKIGITVTVFNRREFTEQCLLSILWSKPQETAVCLVDNGSTDGTRELLIEYHNKYDIFKHIIFNKENLYVGGAINQGWSLLSKYCDVIGAINNDFMVAPGWDINVRACITELKLDWLISSVRPDREHTKQFTPSKTGKYTIQRRNGAGIFLRSEHFKKGIRPSSEPWGRPGYTGHGTSWHKRLRREFPNQEMVRLASPGIVIRKPEYNKPEYVEYYNTIFKIRGKEALLKKFRKGGRGWLDWDGFLKIYYPKKLKHKGNLK